MANFITTARLLLLLLLVMMAYRAPPGWQLLDAPLVLVIFILDAVDGYVARRRHEATAFGSMYDIAADRIVEVVLWIVLADLGLVPAWVAVVFVVRGNIVDAVRYRDVSQGTSAMGTMHTPWGRRIVSGRAMRAFYGTLKAVTFAWILALQPWPELDAVQWAEVSAPLQAVAAALVYLAVTVCIVRGAPVLIEALSEVRLYRRERPVEAGS